MCNLLGDLGKWLTLLFANQETTNKGKWGRKETMPWYSVSHSTKCSTFHCYHHCRPVQKVSLLASIDKRRSCRARGASPSSARSLALIFALSHSSNARVVFYLPSVRHRQGGRGPFVSPLTVFILMPFSYNPKSLDSHELSF